MSYLIEYACSLWPTVPIGVEAAIGLPDASWDGVTKTRPFRSGNFIDFLLSASLPANFFDPVAKAEDWSPERPFIRPPPGPWSLRAFVGASVGGFYQKIDSRLHGNPIFVTSGIPGSVSSGTRVLWQELIALGKASRFRVWPFHGSLGTLVQADTPVIAEIYPKACNGIALAKALPTPLLSIGKTREMARRDALARLRNADWLAREQIAVEDLDAALANEDDFDALVSTAALMRMVVENVPLEGPDGIHSTIEGSVLGAASFTTSTIPIAESQRTQSVPVTKKRSTRASRACLCPIPGCHHVFHNSLGGWDAHVASVVRHPGWHPDVLNATERKRLFKFEFPEWFTK